MVLSEVCSDDSSASPGDDGPRGCPSERHIGPERDSGREPPPYPGFGTGTGPDKVPPPPGHPNIPPKKGDAPPVIVIDAPYYPAGSPDKVIEAYSAVYDSIGTVGADASLVIYDSGSVTADWELISAIAEVLGVGITSDSRVLQVSETVISSGPTGLLNNAFLEALKSSVDGASYYHTLLTAMILCSQTSSEEGAYQAADFRQPVFLRQQSLQAPSGSDPPSYIPGTAEDRIVPTSYEEYLQSHVYDGGHTPFF